MRLNYLFGKTDFKQGRMLLTSNHLAFASMAFAVLAAAAALWGAITSSNETNAAVKTVEAQAKISISKAREDAEVNISVARNEADVKIAHSNAQSAAAAKEAAVANLRAATFEVEAQQLRSQISYMKNAIAGRSLTDRQKVIIGKNLKGYSLDIAVCHQQDLESRQFADEILMTLYDSGQKVTDIGDKCGFRMIGVGAIQNVHVYAMGKLGNELKNNILYKAFSQADLKVQPRYWIDQKFKDMYVINIPARYPVTNEGLKLKSGSPDKLKH